VSPARAVSCVRSGDSVFVGTACATPRTLLRALETSEQRLADVRLVHFLTDGSVADGDVAPRFRHTAFFVGSDARPLAGSDRLDYVPVSLGEVRRLIESGRVPIDVAFVQVTPPDEAGDCSLGVSVDITLAAVEAARTVVAEINPRMPRTRGASTVPFARFAAAALVDEPVIEYLHPPLDAAAAMIARYVARIVENGATLQIGLGRVPNGMLRHLTNRRDLGIHSDVITEPLVDLITAGAVTGSRKSLHPGKVVASYCMGTRRLYDLVDDNELFEFHPIDYVGDPAVIAANARMVSVTQAFAVDLGGQVCADQFEGGLYGGVSSQPEFLRGAAAAEGGKAIVCVASTTDDGTRTRIVPALREGEGVTIPRSDVHWVISEYGSAYLFGRSLRERALALIELAAPPFREELLEAAKRLGLVPREQTLKSRRAYPAELEGDVALKDGRTVLLRPTRAADVDGLQALFYALSEKDVYTRFFTNLSALPVSKAQHLCSVSHEGEVAFVAVSGPWEDQRVVGNACYYLDPSTNLADVAYMIHPAWQGVGLASAMQARLTEVARARGLRGFTADVLAANTAMLGVFERSGCRISKRLASGAYEITMLLD
jgi:acyl-CoA hydrolase/RimJ/RimL family protein N-acetyltransferase